MYSLYSLANDETLPDIAELENPKTNLASVIYSADLKEIGNYYHENRTNIHFNYLPDHLVNALVATEDERFFEHSGIGIGRIGGSALESMARQPEMMGDIRTNMIIAAALVEGVALFGVVVALLQG